MRFSSSLTVYKPKEFFKVLNSLGYFFHHKNSSHQIYANIEGLFVTVPINGKEINAMMTTVCLQRIKNGQCHKLDINTINKYKESFYKESGSYIQTQR